MKNTQQPGRDEIERFRCTLLKRDFLDLLPPDVAKEIANQTELNLGKKLLTIRCESFAHAMEWNMATYSLMVKGAGRSPRLTELADTVRYEWNYGLRGMEYPLYPVKGGSRN
ncbi:MAG: hypothetical protein HC769_21785 [Cyanobacteria bacterium CRU_2_1]|nr:hypothetical protein [Cyanobacteria bacterium CRU_2_1]